MKTEIDVVPSSVPRLPVAENVHTGSGDIYSNVGSITFVNNYFNQQYYPDEDIPDYYNLFVIPKQSFDGTLTISKKKVLCESIDPVIRKHFAGFDLAIQEEIKKIPCIFATKNRHGRYTDENHMASFGFIRNISDLGDYLKIEYAVNAQIYQQRINENEDVFQLQHAAESNELDNIHWTIKKVNIRRLLKV